MKFVQDKEGRRIFLREEELTCGNCGATKQKRWYYYDPFKKIYCKQCANNPKIHSLVYTAENKEPFYLIDEINIKKEVEE